MPGRAPGKRRARRHDDQGKRRPRESDRLHPHGFEPPSRRPGCRTSPAREQSSPLPSVRPYPKLSLDAPDPSAHRGVAAQRETGIASHARVGDEADISEAENGADEEGPARGERVLEPLQSGKATLDKTRLEVRHVLAQILD